jgi:hypothetical protein
VAEPLFVRLVRNPQYKLLSVCIALGVWAYVQNDEVLETHVTTPVNWILPDGLVTVEGLPMNATARVRGTRRSTRKATESHLELTVDLSQLNVGPHDVVFESHPIDGMPSGVSTLGFVPPGVALTLDEVAYRNVEVVPVLVGEPAAGYTVDAVDLSPAVVELAGPRQTVAAVREARTQPIDISGMTSDGTIQIALDLPRSIELAKTMSLSASVSVAPLLERRILGRVPVHIWRSSAWRPEDVEVEVTLEGPAAALRDVETETTVAFVHLPDKPEKDRYEAPFGPNEGVRLRVLHPGGEEVSVVKVKPARVRVVRQ